MHFITAGHQTADNEDLGFAQTLNEEANVTDQQRSLTWATIETAC